MNSNQRNNQPPPNGRRSDSHDKMGISGISDVSRDSDGYQVSENSTSSFRVLDDEEITDLSNSVKISDVSGYLDMNSPQESIDTKFTDLDSQNQAENPPQQESGMEHRRSFRKMSEKPQVFGSSSKDEVEEFNKLLDSDQSEFPSQTFARNHQDQERSRRIKKEVSQREEEIKTIKRKYKKLKIEYARLSNERKADKEKITASLAKIKQERLSSKKQLKELDLDQKDTLLMVLNKLKDALDRPHVNSSINPDQLTLELGGATGEIKQKLEMLEILESQQNSLPSRDLTPPPTSHSMQVKPMLPPPPKNELKLKVEVIKSFWQADLVGKLWTMLAMKDESNYLIGTHEKGLILVKDGKEVYAEPLPEKGKRLWDMVYAKNQDCYFLCHHEKLWKKTNDSLPPTLFFNIEFGFRVAACMEYSTKKNKLVVNAGGSRLTVINPQKAEVEMAMPRSQGDLIRDFKLFGANENKVISITMDGNLAVVMYNESNRQCSLKMHQKIPLKSERNEKGLGVSVCSRNQIACVSLVRDNQTVGINIGDLLGGLFGGKEIQPSLTSTKLRPICSRFMIFEISDSALTLKACLDCYQQEIGRMHALRFVDSIGCRAIFVGLSSDNGDVHILDYNASSRVFRELEDYRVSNCEDDPVQILKVGESFYFIGRHSNLVKLSIKKNGLFL